MIAHASGYNTAAPEIANELNVPVAIVDTPDALKEGLIADYTLSGHTGAYHQYFSGRHLAGGRDLAGEKAPEMLRCFHYCPVTRDVCHGTQGVNLLCA